MSFIKYPVLGPQEELLFMLLVAVLWVPALANVEEAEKKCDLADFADVPPTLFGEYCVKVVVFCYTIFDDPFSRRKGKKNYDLYVRECYCEPDDLGESEKRQFWVNVRQWETLVREVVLLNNIYDYATVYDNGNCLSTNLNSLLHIDIQVTCNRTSMYEKLLNQSSGCDENSYIGMWVDKQFELADRTNGLVSRLPHLSDKLDGLVNKTCCPYRVIRDRIEIINDNIDALLKADSIPILDRAVSSGDASQDFTDLVRRLQYLTQSSGVGNPPFNTCCSDCRNELKRFNASFALPYLMVDVIILDVGILQNKNSVFKMRIADWFRSWKEVAKDCKVLEDSIKNWKCCNTTDEIMNAESLEFHQFDELSTGLISESIANASIDLPILINAFEAEKIKIGELKALCAAKKVEVKMEIEARKVADKKLNRLYDGVQNIAKNVQLRSKVVGGPDLPSFFKLMRNTRQNISNLENHIRGFLSKTEELRTRTLHFEKEFEAARATFPTKCWLQLNQLSDMMERESNFTSGIYSEMRQMRAGKTYLNKEFDKLSFFLQGFGTTHITRRTAKPVRNEILGHLRPMLYSEIGEMVKQNQSKKINHLIDLIEQTSNSEMNVSSDANNQTEKIFDLWIKLKDMTSNAMKKLGILSDLELEIFVSVENKLNDIETQLDESRRTSEYMDIIKRIDSVDGALSAMHNHTNQTAQEVLSRINIIEDELSKLLTSYEPLSAAAVSCGEECTTKYADLPTLQSLMDRLQALEAH